MRITIDLHTDEIIALRRLAEAEGMTIEEAALASLRDALIASGWLDIPPLDEDTETVGEA
jgi:hypothetical protein